MNKVIQILSLALLLVAGVSATAEERCVTGTRCLSAVRFDAAYVCRTTSYSGYGYPVSYRIGDRYVCEDQGYGGDSRAWPGGNYTGQYVCCFDPYGY